MNPKSTTLEPRDHTEAVAIFRAQVIGALARANLARGELRAELRRLSSKRFRPPRSKTTRRFSVPTLERWLYAYRRGGLEALKPKRRRDCGHARGINDELRDLLLDIRREHPSVSVPLILRTLVADGRLERGAVSPHAVRRFYADHGLDRRSVKQTTDGKRRMRWQTDTPFALWHGDVCHATSLIVDGKRRPLRIHALLDDASRYIVAIEARHTEQEVDMLQLLVGALRRHGRPQTLYLDNGSTYRGKILSVACTRLEIALIHAQPYDPQARGKMERLWGTLRRGCLDHIGSVTSLHDVNVRLWAFVDQHYHRAPHAGLMGRTPASVWRAAVDSRVADGLEDNKLRDAMTVRKRRRVRGDGTISIRGQLFELAEGSPTGAVVTIAYCALDAQIEPWVEHKDKVLALRPVDVVVNSRRKRPQPQQPSSPSVDFDPARALLVRATGRGPKGGDR
jgi:transposase InsO family protein